MTLANVDAEKGIICGFLYATPEQQHDLLRRLAPNDFHTPAHEDIWSTMQVMAAQGRVIDAITIITGLAQHGYQRHQALMPDLVSLGTVAVQALAYAGDVKDLATRRRLVAAGARVQQSAESAEVSPAGLVAAAQAELEDAWRPLETVKTHAADHLEPLLEDLRDKTPPLGVSWPYADAHYLLKPLKAGQFVVIGGRPGVGKSVALADIARHAALKERKTTVVFSLEMSSQEYLQRIISAESGIKLTTLQEKSFEHGQWERVEQAASIIGNSPLHIIDDPSCTLADIRARAKELHADLVAVDYLQIATVNPKLERRIALEEFSRGLKVLAKQQQIPVVTAAQLNRSAAQSEHPPRLSDLRETGAIEQDADVVILLDRPDYQNKEHQRAGEVDYVIAKHRNGPTGTITLTHHLHVSRFADMAH